MSKIKRIWVLLFMVFVLSLVSCGEEKKPTPDVPTGDTPTEVTYNYEINKTTLTLEVGATEKLTVSVTPNKEFSAVFSSSNAEIASVANDGTVTAVSAGTATITVEVDGKELTCSVTVNAKPVVYEYSLNFNSITIQEEQTKKLLVIVDPEKEISPNFVSSNPDVATVSVDGTVTGVSEGTATITVTVDGKELTCSVTVNAKPIEYTYEINKSNLDLNLGETDELKIIVTPEPETSVVPTWTSSNDNVATVSAAGLVTAVGKGSATITASLNGEEYTCAVTVNSDVVLNSATMIDGADVLVNLTDASETLDTLYWEHYQEQGKNQMLNAEDLIISNSIENSNRNFYDYRSKIGWSNGSLNSAWDETHGGKCSGDEIEIQVKVNPNVKQIVVFTGGWRATGVASIYLNGVKLGSSDAFLAEESGIARIVTFDINVTNEAIVVIKVTPSNIGDGGNVSNPAVVVLGNADNNSTTNVSMSKTEMTGHNTWNINLTDRGNLDWYYVNASNPVRKLEGSLIDASVISGGDFWDYKAAFTWNNGSANVDADDTNGANGKCAGAVRVDVNVNSNVKHIYLYVGGYQSTYYVQVIDSKGNILHNELLHEATGGSIAYELDYLVNSTADDKLSFIIYRLGGGNCSLAAIAVADKDIEYNYTLSNDSFKMNINDVQKLTVSVDPYKLFTPEYTSSDANVATVAADGTITAIGLGEATITVKIGEVELICAINVVEIDYIYTINKDALDLAIGDSATLSVTAEPVKDDLYVVWTSNNQNVVKVDDNGQVLATGKGTATITGTIGNKSVTCDVTVSSPITISEVKTESIEGTHHDLTNNSSDYETLYWEHYQNQGTDAPINAKDMIISNNIEQSERSFGDYKATLGWSNGTNIVAWDKNANGKHTYDGVPVIEMEIEVTPNVKQIKLYVGAWNATGIVTLNINGVEIAKSEEFTAGGDSVAKLVTFNINVEENCTIEIKVDPINLTGGNVSNQAVVILGESANSITTFVEMSKTAIVGNKDTHTYTHVNLTQRGTLDWYYVNFDHQTDQMKDADYIKSVSHEGNNTAWDYTAAFNWTNGTAFENSPIDNDNNNNGTNNVRYGGYHAIDVLVNSSTKYIYLYVGGYESTYIAQVIDSKGQIILTQEIANVTSQYEVRLAVNASVEEELTIVIYKASGANCSLAAVAVADVDNTFTLKNNKVTMNVTNTFQLEVLANPTQEFTATYASSNEAIATIDENGLITAVANGEAKITVTINNIELVCEVTVEEAKIQYEYSINNEELNLDYGQSHNLVITVTPEKTLDIIWASENNEVATVENGVVKAVGVGETTITATVDEEVFEVTVTVTKSVSATASVEDGEGKTVDLSHAENLLYWEHYQGKYFDAVGISSKLGAEDIILENNIINSNRAFGDYKTTFSWINGTNLSAWLNDNNGLCTDAEVVAKVKVNSNVNKIEVYTGAWRATGVVTLYLNGAEIAKSDTFTAGESGIARIVTFTLTVEKEAIVEIRITPSELGDSGNVSNPAILVYGIEEVTEATTELSMSKVEMIDRQNSIINLTEKGTIDWYYSQYDHTPDEMANGSAISNVSIGNSFWDYKADFTWSNGTNWENNPKDNGEGEVNGTNNGKCSDFFMSLNVNVDENINNIYLYVSGWCSTYGIAVVDGNGNIIFDQQIAENNGQTQAFECNFAVNATAEDTLTFVREYTTTSGNLPQTGAAIGTTALLGLGGLLTASGVALRKRRK